MNLNTFKNSPLFSGYLISILLHAGLAISMYTYLFAEDTEEREEIPITLWSGAEGKEGAGSGEGKGSKRAALAKERNTAKSSGISDGTTAAKAGRSDGFADGVGADWGTADDPALDGGSRYSARIAVQISDDDYPSAARRANLGNVVVAVTLLISAEGKISDVRIRYVRGTNVDNFKNDFITATRKIFLQKARIVNMPYAKNGKRVHFVWDTSVTFKMENI
jgi:hypothetical protein